MPKFSWRHSGRTPNGNTVRLSGDVEADDHGAAADKVDAMLRKLYPQVVWMQAGKPEGDRIKYLPSTKLLK